MQDQNLDKQIERQMGCMAGFLQLFDRHQILTGKRLYSTKRLPPTKSQVADAAQVSEKSSPAVSAELGKPQPVVTPSPERPKQFATPELRSPELLPPKSPLPLPIFEMKGGTRTSWKFGKEAPRLSLDSRATVDAKGSLHPKEIRTNASILTPTRSDNAGAGDGDDKQRRSPSVIARLMGLEPLPDSDTEPVKKAELRRSASESRVSRDLFQYRFIDNGNLQLKQPNQSYSNAERNENKRKGSYPNTRPVDAMDLHSFRNVNANSEQPKSLNRGFATTSWRSQQHRRSFFDTADVFPEPRQTMSMYGDIEKRLKVRGIEEPSKDLETLKQILEALQLKGLLHSRRPTEHRNLVYDGSFLSEESPIVVMKPSKSPTTGRRLGSDSPPARLGVRRNINTAGGDNLPSFSPRRERQAAIDRNVRSPVRGRNLSSQSRNDGNPRRANNSIVKPKPLSVEIQRRGNESLENRRGGSPVQSPKLSPRRMCSTADQSVTNRSPRNRKSTTAAEIYQKDKITTLVTEDESSSISESTISTPSQTDTERSKMEEYKEGKSLLERCDKLLHSIAEMTAAANANDMQPSPVSVLDSSFYKEDDSSSPSPVMKRSIDFKDYSGEFEDETWSGTSFLSVTSKLEGVSDDSDFVYISEIIRASHYFHNEDDSDLFLLLEKQQYLKGNDTSKASMLQRKLIFDITTGILERNRQLPPWKATDPLIAKPPVQQVWSEFQKIRERGDATDNLIESICGILKKDLDGDAISGWGDCPVELSEAVLDLERLIFKDLIGETIRDLAAFACKSTAPLAFRRKLVF